MKNPYANNISQISVSICLSWVLVANTILAEEVQVHALIYVNILSNLLR